LRKDRERGLVYAVELKYGQLPDAMALMNWLIEKRRYEIIVKNVRFAGT